MNEKNQRRNEIALWRKFDRMEKQPAARGDGLVGENDFKISGSLWPSKKGQRKDGSPWQMWNLSLRPAQGETRKLVAVPSDLLDRVLALIREADGVPPPAEPPDGVGEDSVADDIPF